jgi:hypothetical protein
MLKELNEMEQKVYKVFRSYKSAFRMEYMKSEAGLNPEQVSEVYKSLEEKGYLSSNKLGHYKETIEAQKARLNGLTKTQYIAEKKAEEWALNAKWWQENN